MSKKKLNFSFVSTRVFLCVVAFRWETKLFVTPSRLIFHTGIALGATLIVLLFVLSALQYREKVRRFALEMIFLCSNVSFRKKIVNNAKNNRNRFITTRCDKIFLHFFFRLKKIVSLFLRFNGDEIDRLSSTSDV